jgi:hypothetical protein
MTSKPGKPARLEAEPRLRILSPARGRRRPASEELRLTMRYWPTSRRKELLSRSGESGFPLEQRSCLGFEGADTARAYGESRSRAEVARESRTF